MSNKTQLRVETVGDGSNARADFQKTEAQVGMLEHAFEGLQAKLIELASTASGLNLEKLGGMVGGGAGMLGTAATELGAGGGLAALVTPAAAATAGFGALALAGHSAVEATMELGKETLKLSRETGMSAETTSALISVFARFGVNGADASKELGLFSKQMGGYQLAADEGITGGKKFSDSMKQLGVDFHDAHGKLLPMDDTLLKVADKFKELSNGQEKTSLAMSLFGKGGKDMLLVLNQGSEGITELSAKAKELGLTLTGSNLHDVVTYTLAHKDMQEAFEGLKITVGTLLMPAMAALAKVGAHFAEQINTTLVPALKDENSALRQTFDLVDRIAHKFTDFNNALDGAGAAFGTNILKMLRDLPNDRSADDPLSKWLNEQIANRERLADEAAAKAKEGSQKIAEAAAAGLDDPAAATKAKGYGSDVLTAYVQGMTPDGITMFDDLKKVVEEAMKGMSPTGKVDVDWERAYLPAFARLATEITQIGGVTEATWADISEALGGETQQVKELVADYQALAADKLRVKQVTADIHALESQQRADTAQATRENRELQRGITEAQRNQSEADKAEAENVRGLTEAQKGLGFAQKDAAAAGVAALVPLNAELKSVQESAATVALGYKSQNDELQRQIDLNNQIVGQLEHQRDVKFLAIDERLAEIGKSRDTNDLREAATLRRERAQEERNTKPQIALERERATVENYGLSQAQKGIADKAKAASDASAAQTQSLQAQITAQTAHNAAVQAGFQHQIEDSQKVIDTVTNAARVRHDDDNQRIVDLQEVATATAQFWQDRQAADGESITAARESLTFWQGQVTEANTLLTSVKAINAEIAASGQFGQTPIWMRPTSGGTQGDNPNGDNPNGDNPNGDNPNGDNPNGDNPNGDGAGAIPGPTHDRTVDSGYGDGAGALPPTPSGQPADYAGPGPNPMLYLGKDGSLHPYAPGGAGGYQIPDGNSGGGGASSSTTQSTINVNNYGVGEAAFLDKLTGAIQRVSAA